jgi:hypothetical protein
MRRAFFRVLEVAVRAALVLAVVGFLFLEYCAGNQTSECRSLVASWHRAGATWSAYLAGTLNP